MEGANGQSKGGVFAAGWNEAGVEGREAKQQVFRELPRRQQDELGVLAFAGLVISAIAPSICSNGFAVLNKTDDGYFARGVYVTFDSAYAAIYAGGLIPLELQSPANEMTIIAAWAVVVNPYPITRGIDYVKTNHQCDLFGSTVKSGYDSHFVLVDRQAGPGSVDYQACVDAGGAVPLSYTYSELVLKDEAQVMPRSVLRCRKKASAAPPPGAPVLPVPSSAAVGLVCRLHTPNSPKKHTILEGLAGKKPEVLWPEIRDGIVL